MTALPIEVRDLEFGYERQTILDDFDAEFEPGTVTALIGKSGSGKSTLLYIIGLMVAPWSGRLTIGQQETTSLTDAERARFRAQNMGFVFQDALLDPARSVLDNVLEPSLYRETQGKGGDEALELLERFEVTVDPARKPGQISGGQAQRVALCRAFLGSPSIVLADEPTGNLDSDTASVVWQALRDRAAQGATVIVATHDASRASDCDQVIRIDDGS